MKGANSVKIIGPNLRRLEQTRRPGHATRCEQVAGVADLGIFQVLGQPNSNIKVDREKAARYGLNTGDVNAVVQAALGGTVATTLLEGDRQFARRRSGSLRNTAQSIDAVRDLKVAYSTPERHQRLYSAERARRHHARYRRVLSSTTSAASATSRSSSACAAATSAAPSRRRSERIAGSVQAADRLPHRSGPANSKNCSRPRRG